MLETNVGRGLTGVVIRMDDVSWDGEKKLLQAAYAYEQAAGWDQADFPI